VYRGESERVKLRNGESDPDQSSPHVSRGCRALGLFILFNRVLYLISNRPYIIGQKVVVELDYHTSEDDLSVPRHAHFTRHITTTLPLMIQAHDHFRGKRCVTMVGRKWKGLTSTQSAFQLYHFDLPGNIPTPEDIVRQVGKHR
jgi:hypothetical protein